MKRTGKKIIKGKAGKASPGNAGNKEAALKFLFLVVSGKVSEAFDNFVSPDFRHHNPYFRGDRVSLLKAMEENWVKNPRITLEPKIAMEEGNLVSIHSHVKTTPEDLGLATVHLMKFRDGKIEELWDLVQPIPKDSPNENGFF